MTRAVSWEERKRFKSAYRPELEETTEFGSSSRLGPTTSKACGSARPSKDFLHLLSVEEDQAHDARRVACRRRSRDQSLPVLGLAVRPHFAPKLHLLQEHSLRQGSPRTANERGRTENGVARRVGLVFVGVPAAREGEDVKEDFVWEGGEHPELVSAC